MKEQTQSIEFHEKFWDALLSGKKTTTVRYGARNYALGDVLLRSGEREVVGQIEKVRQTRFHQLRDADGIRDGFSGVVELFEALQEFYQDITIDSVVTVVSLRVPTSESTSERPSP